MPIYEYECTQCGTVTDIRHGFKETVGEACAHCGGTLKRVFRPTGIVFKGSGFYVTDSRKASASTSSAGSTSASSASSKEGAPAKAGAKETTPAKEGTSAAEGASPKESGSGKSEAKGSKGSEAAA
ncbi:MAG: FmdB family zinc ribbon protein [Candidatus Baltobacteraceae bacterium]